MALIPPIGHAVWALARSAGEVNGASPVAIALAAAMLELSLFAGLVAAVVGAARMNGARVTPLELVRRLALAQSPAALYFLGLVPAITHFAPLLPLVLAARLATSVRVTVHVERLGAAVAVAAVLIGSAVGVLLGFATASLIYS
ncbi:MAG: hypothetical protein ACRDGT_10090 [Candidatus Limnocylindria bacterium]